MRKFFFVFMIIPFLFACRSKPPVIEPEQNPSAELILEHIEAHSINKFTLHYRLIAVNPRSIPATIIINDWTGQIDETKMSNNYTVLLLEGSDLNTPFLMEPVSSTEKKLALEIDLSKQPVFANSSAESDHYSINITLNMGFTYGQQTKYNYLVSTDSVFPRIKEPQFSIISIAILQAELINTRFRVRIKIDNPNIFPVALSSFSYELYGNGKFWTDGREKELLDIPALSSGETNIYLMMNFINMSRQLLDDIIAMRDVSYRFLGEAEVKTNMALLPGFRMNFERSGNSPVYR